MEIIFITDLAKQYGRNILMLRRKAKTMGVLMHDDNGRTCVMSKDVQSLLNRSVDYVIDASKASYTADHKYVTLNSQHHITGISKETACVRIVALGIERVYLPFEYNGQIQKTACIKVTDAVRIKEYKTKPNKRFTYLGTDASGLWKIGQTDTKTQREMAIKNMNPTFKIKYIGAVRFESRLHELFKNKRVSGEWYALTDGDVECIVSTLRLEEVK